MGRTQVTVAIEVPVTKLLRETQQSCPFSRLLKKHNLSFKRSVSIKPPGKICLSALWDCLGWVFWFCFVFFKSHYCATILSAGCAWNRQVTSAVQEQTRDVRFFFFLFPVVKWSCALVLLIWCSGIFPGLYYTIRGNTQVIWEMSSLLCQIRSVGFVFFKYKPALHHLI